MMTKNNQTLSRTWSKIEENHRKIKDVNMKDLFLSDTVRFK